jgi:hypothetical protein
MLRFACCLVVVLPTSVLAETTLLQRYEAAQERLDTNIDTMMITKLPELQGFTPLREWTEVDRAIGQCVLDAVAKERGPDGLEAFVAAYEHFSTITFRSMNHIVEATPPEVTGAALVTLMQECGVFERSMQLQTQSGMAAITGNLANLERMMAE